MNTKAKDMKQSGPMPWKLQLAGMMFGGILLFEQKEYNMDNYSYEVEYHVKIRKVGK